MPKLVPFCIALASASRTIGGAWPSTSGPQERTKSMYYFPSASQIRAPSPRAATTGSPPTPRNARTGEFTPPGKSSRARAMISADRTLATVAADRHLLDWKLAGDTLHSRSTGRQSNANNGRLKIVVVHNFFDCHLGDRARRQRFIELSHAVDVIGLPREPRLGCPALGVASIDDRHRGAANSRLVFLRRDRALKLREPFEALPLHGLVHIIGILRSTGSFLGRIREGADSLELHLLQEFQKLVELLLGLSR